MVIVPLLRGRNGEMTPTRNAEINLFHLHHLVFLLQPCGTLPPSIVFMTCSFTSLCFSTLLLLLLVLLSLLLTPYPVTERPYRTSRWDPSGWGGEESLAKLQESYHAWTQLHILTEPESTPAPRRSVTPALLASFGFLRHRGGELDFCFRFTKKTCLNFRTCVDESLKASRRGGSGCSGWFCAHAWPRWVHGRASYTWTVSCHLHCRPTKIPHFMLSARQTPARWEKCEGRW